MTIALWVGLGLGVLVLALVPFIPFQDVPNHVQLLMLDRVLKPGQVTAFYERPSVSAYGYSLYLWIDRLVAGHLSAEGSVRLMTILCFFTFPLAVARLARVAGGSGEWAGLLALPLALSWPLRLGLLPYVLALPCAFCLLAAAIRVCERPTFGRSAWLCGFAFLTYIAHPVAFGMATGAAALAWLCLGLRRPYAAVGILAPFAAVFLLICHDIGLGLLDRVLGTEVTWPQPPLVFRPLEDALAHIFTRSYGITNAAALVSTLPLLCIVVFLIVRALLRPPALQSPAVRTYLIVIAVLFSLGTVIVPLWIGVAFELGPRVPVIGVAIWTAIAACAASRCGARLGRYLRVSSAIAVAIALGFALREVKVRAQRVSSILGEQPTHELSGRFLTARLNDCKNLFDGNSWGFYDPARHLWPYTMSIDGVTPYLFAFSRYLPIWYRGEVYARLLAGPDDFLIQSQWAPRERCESNNLLRLLWTLNWQGYDGVVVVELPEKLERALARLPSLDVRKLGPAVALLKPRQAVAHAPASGGAGRTAVP